MNTIMQVLNPNSLYFYTHSWTLIWKGIALWHSARNQTKKGWFIVLLIS